MTKTIEEVPLNFNKVTPPNPFEGSGPNIPRSKFPQRKGGFDTWVEMRCSCGFKRNVRTEDFRLNWVCEDCLDSPLLIRLVRRYMKDTGISK